MYFIFAPVVGLDEDPAPIDGFWHSGEESPRRRKEKKKAEKKEEQEKKKEEQEKKKKRCWVGAKILTARLSPRSAHQPDTTSVMQFLDSRKKHCCSTTLQKEPGCCGRSKRATPGHFRHPPDPVLAPDSRSRPSPRAPGPVACSMRRPSQALLSPPIDASR